MLIDAESWYLSEQDIERAKAKAREAGAAMLLHFEVSVKTGPRIYQEMEHTKALPDDAVEAYLQTVREEWKKNRGVDAAVRQIAVYAL